MTITATKGKTSKVVKNKNKELWVAVVLDESGSMGRTRDRTISGFNEFLQDRKTDAKMLKDIKFTLTKFGGSPRPVVRNKSVKKVNELNRETYKPNGSTSLYDAVGITINNLAKDLKMYKKKYRPDVMFLIITDGEENTSREFNSEQIKKMIQKRTEKHKWTFSYMGANHDAWAAAKSMGISPNNSANFNVLTAQEAFAGLSNTLSRETRIRAASSKGAMTTTDMFNGVKNAEDLIKDKEDSKTK